MKELIEHELIELLKTDVDKFNEYRSWLYSQGIYSINLSSADFEGAKFDVHIFRDNGGSEDITSLDKDTSFIQKITDNNRISQKIMNVRFINYLQKRNINIQEELYSVL